MEQGQNSSASISTLRLLASFFVLSLLLQSEQTSAQFTQTYGWGGAGHGKRSSFNKRIPAAPFTTQRQCVPDKRFQNYIIELIQGELVRLRRCRDAEMFEESINFSNVVPEVLP